MLRFLRLSNGLRKLSLFEFSSLFQVNAKTSAIMSKAAAAEPEVVTKSPDTIENIEGAVKFLELVGNLKVSGHEFLHLFPLFLRNIILTHPEWGSSNGLLCVCVLSNLKCFIRIAYGYRVCRELY